MLKILVAASAVFLFEPVVVFAQTDTSVQFGAREHMEGVSISPSGDQIAFIQPSSGEGSELFIAKTADGSTRKITYVNGKPWKLHWCNWASNTRLVCQMSALIDDPAGLLTFTRLVAINSDGTQIKELGKKSTRSTGRMQFDGALVGWSENDDGSIIMSRNYASEFRTGTMLANSQEGLGVDRVDTLTMQSYRMEQPKKSASAFIAGTKGDVRILQIAPTNDEGYLKDSSKYFLRYSNDQDWHPVTAKDDKGELLSPVAVDSSKNIAYAFGKKGGRAAIYTIALDQSQSATLLYANDKVDVDSLLSLGRSGRVIGVEIITDRRQPILFDEGINNLAKKLGKAIPGLPLVRIVDASRDENRLVLFAGSDVDPGRYYLYDQTKKTLSEIGQVRPNIADGTLSPVKVVNYPAADGTLIPAYLTLPKGAAEQNLPTIVIPHGGPSSRDEWGFDWISQFFAAQGFAVLQPNFRGSSGYGDEWYINNGFKSWRTAVGDVNDAGRWLIKEKIASSDKLVVFGWSYGGYAALQSSALDADLFKAIVAVAPVTDLGMLIEQSRNYDNFHFVEEFVGKGEHIISGSPLKQVGKIKAPVLLFSGDHDVNVDVSQARAMNNALTKAAKTSDLVIYKDRDHQLNDSEVRADLLRKSDQFFRDKLSLK
jgi:dipeptidyl aminopeptidase/acylaminoacyl peptidase